MQKCSRFSSQAKNHEDERNVDSKLQEYMDLNNELKLQILKKEGEIDSKSCLINTLQNQMNTEVGLLKTYERGMMYTFEMHGNLPELNDFEIRQNVLWGVVLRFRCQLLFFNDVYFYAPKEGPVCLFICRSPMRDCVAFRSSFCLHKILFPHDEWKLAFYWR